MVYLYASLGVLMLTGIMAMFEMAMSFNAQQIIPPAYRFVFGSTYQQADQDLLRLLTKKDLCSLWAITARHGLERPSVISSVAASIPWRKQIAKVRMLTTSRCSNLRH